MVWIIILLIVLLLLVAVLMCKVSVVVDFAEGISAKVKVAGIEVYVYPESVGKKVKKSLKHEEKNATQQPNFFGQLKKEHGLFGAVSFILGIVKRVLIRLGKLFSHIHIDKLHLDLTVSSDDAAKTAIVYGEVCSVLYPVIALIDSTNHIKDKIINVSTDFGCINPELRFNISIHAKAVFLLLTLVLILSDISKINNKKKGAAK